MNIAEQAEYHEQLERDIIIRETLGRLVPSEPQVVVVDSEGHPKVVCSDCLALIPLERLHALPKSIRCIGCQEAHERR